VVCSCPKRLNEHAIPFSRYPKSTLGSITYFLNLAKYYIVIPKPTRKPIPSLGYLIIKHHGFTILEGYCSCSKLHNIFAMPFITNPINTLGSITYFFKLGGVMHNPTNVD
jgi:hypothetical protein